MAFLAAIAFILAFVHPWRSIKKFRNLVLASVLSRVVFIGLQILTDLVLKSGGQARLLDGIVNAASTTVIMLCMAGMLVGAIGAVLMAWRERRPGR